MAKITPRIQRIAQRTAGIKGAIGASRAKVQERINIEGRLAEERDAIREFIGTATDLTSQISETKEDFDLYKKGGGEGGIIQFLKSPAESSLFIEKGKEAALQSPRAFYTPEGELQFKPIESTAVDESSFLKSLIQTGQVDSDIIDGGFSETNFNPENTFQETSVNVFAQKGILDELKNRTSSLFGNAFRMMRE